MSRARRVRPYFLARRRTLTSRPLSPLWVRPYKPPRSRSRCVCSEPLELRFSTFRIAPLETDATDPREIKLAAQDLTEEVMSAENSENEAQLAVLTSERTSQEVVLGLSDLSPGTYPQTYVVMWRLLSAYTHTSDDFITFTMAPDPPAPGTAEGN